MKSLAKEYQKKAIADLNKEMTAIHQEIAKAKLERKALAVKDTNIISKKRKRLAVIMTMINIQRREKESA